MRRTKWWVARQPQADPLNDERHQAMNTEIPPISVSYADAKPQLSLRVYGTAHRDTSKLHLLNQADGTPLPAVRDVVGDISVGVSLNQGGIAIPVSEEQLAAWDTTLGGASLMAARNALVAENDSAELSPGLYVVTSEDFAGAIWTVPRLAASIPVKGAPVVIGVTQEYTIVAGADDPEALVMAATVLIDYLDSGERIESVTPYIFKDQAWKPFSWSGEVAQSGVAREIDRRFTSLLYARQRPVLEAFYKRKNADVHVADCPVMKNAGGTAQTVATWTRGAVSAIPVADLVFFAGDGVPAAGAPWAEVVKHLGEYLQPVKSNPERYFTNGFPSAEQFAAVTAS